MGIKPVINNMDDVENIIVQMTALRNRISEIRLKQEKECNELRSKINDVMISSAAKARPMLDIYEAQYRELENFMRTNRAAIFAGLTSKKLRNGEIGFRMNPASLENIEGRPWSEIALELKRARQYKFIRQIIEVDKRSLMKAGDEFLEQFGVRRKQEEKFYALDSNGEKFDAPEK